MLIGPRALKSLNSREKIQPKMMVTTFNGNANAAIISCYSPIGLVGRVFANGPVNLGSIPGRVIPKTLKIYLIPPGLTLGSIRYISRVKWSNSEKGVVPSPTPRWGSY